ncbi:SDR family oxidoreductase [Paenibacillus sp. JCM 10914]|uniref:SDR family oxidoreductase n=1 Tax=Paenibacillus sp. JCM 10914 TaxID=1236974 RepID=UPI0003CC9C3C|nr:SDR family oxidoreductase [Paenibacillus sp. JCM 10914]GAE07848.1 NAD(P)HX epimerase [Paenibacillus sp. JCM 10914]
MSKANETNHGRVALVTGGNRGIGKEIARQLAIRGLQVIITSRDEGRGYRTVEDLQAAGLRVAMQAADMRQLGDVARLVKHIQQQYGRLDVLVNNAGIILDQGVSVLDVEETIMKETLEVNFYGALRMTQACVPLMKMNQYGRIVNISSGLGAFEIMDGTMDLGIGGTSSAYRISKTMLNALTCMVSEEVTGTGIKVNAVCPGRVRTDMGGQDAPLTVAEGADTAVWLATLDEAGISGGFFREREQIAW